MQPLRIDTNDELLIIAPHPDDECIGVGGILALFPEKCTVVVVTDGGRANKETHPMEMKRIREFEFIEEMRRAGIKKYKMLEVQDGGIAQNSEVFCSIDFYRYSKVFLPSNRDNHSDHIFCFTYAIREIIKQNAKDVEVYKYEVHRPLLEPTNYLDITNGIDLKIELIQVHKSQCAIRDYSSQAKALASYRACQEKAVGKYYEVYDRVNLEVCNSGMDISRELLIDNLRWKNSVMNNWLKNRFCNKSVEGILKEKQFYKIGIYGFGEIGKLLHEELINSDIKIEYYIDQKADIINEKNIPVLLPNSYHGNVDAIIVTIPSDAIREKLRSQGYENVVYLNEVLDDV